MNDEILRCFIAIAEENDIGKAATRLGLSTSHILFQLQQLEDELGLALFTCGSSCILLTAAGKTFLPHAHTLALEFKSIMQLGSPAPVDSGQPVSAEAPPCRCVVATASQTDI